jgi:hypothetical protein
MGKRAPPVEGQSAQEQYNIITDLGPTKYMMEITRNSSE